MNTFFQIAKELHVIISTRELHRTFSWRFVYPHPNLLSPTFENREKFTIEFVVILTIEDVFLIFTFKHFVPELYVFNLITLSRIKLT